MLENLLTPWLSDAFLLMGVVFGNSALRPKIFIVSETEWI